MTRHLTFGRTAAVALGAIAVGAVLALLAVIGGTASAGAGSPATAATVEAGRLQGLRYHLVAPGDTLKKVSTTYGISVEQIRSANGMLRDVLYTGARLLLDEPNPGNMAPPSAGSEPAPAVPVTYKIVAGDTLAKIAKRNATTVDALATANQITALNRLTIGQVLAIAPGSTAAAGPAAVCPLPGVKVTYNWGFPRADGQRFHEGNDMFAPEGTPILAAVSGTVTFGSSAMSGKYATLKGNNGWQYYAAHLSRTAKGGAVLAGDVIGYVGDTGDAKGTSPHLHLEVRPLDGRPINPSKMLVGLCTG